MSVFQYYIKNSKSHQNLEDITRLDAESGVLGLDLALVDLESFDVAEIDNLLLLILFSFEDETESRRREVPGAKLLLLLSFKSNSKLVKKG